MWLLNFLKGIDVADLEKEVEFKFAPRKTLSFEDKVIKESKKVDAHNKKYPVKYIISRDSNSKCKNKYDREVRSRWYTSPPVEKGSPTS